MINDPDQRAEFEADVAAVADPLPALRKVMTGFFELVGHQIDEVEQSRRVARQLNDAIGAAAPCSRLPSPTPASTSTSRSPVTPSIPRRRA